MTWLGNPETWEAVKARFSIGSIVTGTVYDVAPFGVFIDLGDDAVGLLLVPEMTGDARKELADYPQIGQSVTAKVIQHRNRQRQVSLTQRT